MRVERRDYGDFRGVTQTPQGGLRVPAAVTRVGVLQYRDASGRTWGELRPREEVFAADSLATLRGAPLTRLHPTEPVTRDNYGALSVGHAADRADDDAGLVVMDLLVQRGDAVDAVNAGELRECSAGYSCLIDETPGEYEGVPYERIQRGIVYNHVALGPSGWGRAGSSVGLRMDGAEQVVEAAPSAPLGAPLRAGRQTMKTIKIRGKTYRLDADGDVAEMQKQVDAIEGEATTAASEIDTAKAKIEELSGQLSTALSGAAQAGAQLETLKAKLAASDKPADPPAGEDAISEQALDAALALRAAARKHLGETFDPKGKKAIEIKKAIVSKVLPSMKLDSFSADHIQGMYLAAVGAEPPVERNDALGKLNTIGNDPNAGARQDDADEEPRWKQPTMISQGGK